MWKIAEDLKQISLGKFEKCWPDDFQIYLNLYDNAINVIMLGNHPCLLCGDGFGNKSFLLYHFAV